MFLRKIFDREFRIGLMQRWNQFSIGYLLLLIFWWAASLSLMRLILDLSLRSRDERAFISYLLLPIFIGPAYGGLVLKMRFGFYAGLTIAGLMYVIFFLVVTH